MREENNKVNIMSTTSNVVLKSVQGNFRKKFTKPNVPFPINVELFDDFMFENGIIVMFQTGTLFVCEESDRLSLNEKYGESFVPRGYVYSKKEDLEKILNIPQIEVFTEYIEKLSKSSLEQLVEVGKTMQISAQKIAALKDITNVDLTNAQAVLAEDIVEKESKAVEIKAPKEDKASEIPDGIPTPTNAPKTDKKATPKTVEPVKEEVK